MASAFDATAEFRPHTGQGFRVCALKAIDRLLFIADGKNCAAAMTSVPVSVLVCTFASEEFFRQGGDD